MGTAFTILAVSTIAGYCIGRYSGKNPPAKKDDTEKNKDKK